HHDDGDRAGCIPRGQDTRYARRDDDVHREADKLRRDLTEAVGLILGEPLLEEDVLALDVAELTQALPERLAVGRARAAPQVANPGAVEVLLRLALERQPSTAREQREARGARAPHELAAAVVARAAVHRHPLPWRHCGAGAGCCQSGCAPWHAVGVEAVELYGPLYTSGQKGVAIWRKTSARKN